MWISEKQLHRKGFCIDLGCQTSIYWFAKETHFLTVIKIRLVQVLLLHRDSSRSAASLLFRGGTSLRLHRCRRRSIFGHPLHERLLLDDRRVILSVLRCLRRGRGPVGSNNLVIALAINDVLMFWGRWCGRVSSSEQVMVGGRELDDGGMLVGGMRAYQVRGLGRGARVDQYWTMGVRHHGGSRLRVNNRGTARQALCGTGVDYGALLLKAVVRRRDSQASLLARDEGRHQATLRSDDPAWVIVRQGRHPHHLWHGVSHLPRLIVIHRLGLNRRNCGKKNKEMTVKGNSALDICLNFKEGMYNGKTGFL